MIWAKRALAITTGTVATLLVLTGCGAISGGAASSKTPSALRAVKTITYVNPRPSYNAFNVAGACITAQAKKYGWTAKEVGTPGTAVDNQAAVNLISASVASGTDGLIVVPLVTSLFSPVLENARSKGIYVVGMNSGSASTGQQAEVGTDSAQMGALMADGLGKKDPKAHVGFLSVSASTASQAAEIKGFEDEAAKKWPGMTFVADAYDNGDATQDVDVFNNMIAAHPDITAIFSLNGSAIGAAVTAVKEAGKTGQITVLGLDLTDQTRALIESGALYAVGDQGWCDMGTKSVEVIKDLSEGKSINFTVPTTSTFITRENLPAK